MYIPLSIGTDENSQYIWPVKGLKIITGSFAEYRNYYFHHGLDFATEGKIGIPIMAMHSGRIIRLQSLKYSIGNSIIILQNDGYSSRYGHLDKYSEKIIGSSPDDIKSKLLIREDFDRELLKGEEIFVEAGEIIGYSGDTGIGPAHLHVELFKDDFYFNPSAFLPPTDTKGEIQVSEVELIPLSDDSYIEEKHLPLNIKIIKQGDRFTMNRLEPIKIKGLIGVHLSAHEASSRSNRIGFQKISTFLNGAEKQEINFFKIKTSHMFRSCFIFDNYRSTMSGRPFKYFLYNKENDIINVFKIKEKNAGSISHKELKNDDSNLFEISLDGLNGKNSKVSILLKPDDQDYLSTPSDKKENIFPEKSSTIFSEDKIIGASFPINSVFSKEFFYVDKTDLKVEEQGIDQISAVYGIRPDFREFNIGYDLNFKIINNENNDKIGLFGINEKGKILRFYQTAIFNSSEQNFKIHLKSTGYYTILRDNTKPYVKVERFKNGHVFERDDFKLHLRAKDTGSGVGEKGISVTIDGDEGKLDYDPEANHWEVFYPARMRNKGSHLLIATPTDRLGNVGDKIEFNYNVK